MTRNFLIITFALITFYGCQNADIEDSSKRNENWVYWVDKTSGKASWIPVKSNETTLKDGIIVKLILFVLGLTLLLLLILLPLQMKENKTKDKKKNIKAKKEQIKEKVKDLFMSRCKKGS